jgi:hypothetical protein
MPGSHHDRVPWFVSQFYDAFHLGVEGSGWQAVELD